MMSAGQPETISGERPKLASLADAPLFAGLSPVARARLMGELQIRVVPAGGVVFRRGDPGDALYIVRSGVAEARAGEGDSAEYPVSLYEPGDSFGESALLTEEPRSTTVVALTELELWVLPKDRFLVLVEQTPGLALTVGRIVSRRLQATHQAVSTMHRAFDAVAEQAYQTLDPEQQRFLRRTAPLDPVDPKLVARALGRSDAAEVLAELSRRLPFVTRRDDGSYRYHRLFRELLLEKLAAELGAAEQGAWLAHLADCAVAVGRAQLAIDLLVQAGDLAAAERLAVAHARSLLAQGERAALERFLDALPASITERSSELADLWADIRAGQGRFQEAIALQERAVSADERAGVRDDDARQLRRFRRLADWSFRVGRVEEGARWLARAGEGAGGFAEPENLLPVAAARRAMPAGARRRRPLAWLMVREREVLGGGVLPRLRVSPRGVGLVLTAALLLWFFLSPPLAGLSVTAYRALGLLVAGLPLLIWGVLGDDLVALLWVVGWTALGLVPARVALSGFATPGWFLVLSVLAVGAALARVGLLYRLVLGLLARVPPSHVLLTLTVAGVGILFSPAMPNATARTALAGPLTLEIADALGYRPRSRGSAAVAMAVLLGFGQMCGLFLTGSSSGLLVYNVLPEPSRARFGWGAWFLAALPLHLVLFVITYVAILLLLRPEERARRAPEIVAAQREALGPLSRGERICAVVFVGLLLAFVLSPLWDIDPAWPGVLAMVILSAAGVLDQQTLRSGVNWSFLIFFGVMLSLAQVFATLQVDAWLAGVLAAPLAPLAGSPALFLVATALAGYVISFVVRWQAACVLMTLVLVPATMPLGIEPWVIGLTALVATNMWFLPYQSTIYQALYYGTDGKAFSHEQARPLALIYGAACLLGLIASVPVWRAMGLLP